MIIPEPRALSYFFPFQTGMIFRGLHVIHIVIFGLKLMAQKGFSLEARMFWGCFLQCLKHKSPWLLQVRNDNIKRRKRKEVDGLKPVVGIYLYSESEQDAGFGNQEVLIF